MDPLISYARRCARAVAACLLLAGAGTAIAQPVVSPIADGGMRTFDGYVEKYQLFNPPTGLTHPGGTMSWYYNDASRPAAVSKATVIAQIQASMAKWSAVCRISFSYLGETTTGFSLVSSSIDGKNVIGWDASSLTAPTTGIANIAWNGSNTIVDAEIRLNAAYSVTYTSALDGTLTHELGHALGLEHSDVSGQVMSGPPLTSYNGSTALASDDIAGCVRLYGAAGGSGPAPDTQAPAVPTGLTATAISTTQINLAWNAATDNVGVTSYKVFQGGTQLGTVPGTSASVTALSPGTTYNFTVSACDAAGNCSAQSASVSRATLAVAVDTQAPSVPTGLSATAFSTTQINLAWTASTDNVGVTGYRIFQGGALLATVTGTSASATGLSPGTTYSFTVSACDAAANCSAQSAPASRATLPVAVDAQAPTVPTGIAATAFSTTQINLAWSASTDNVAVTGYRVFQGGALLGTVTGTSAAATGLLPGTMYSFTVSACDASANCSAQSTSSSATTMALAPAPTCSGPQPPNDQQVLACPAGQTGSMVQMRSYSCIGSTWAPGAYQTVSNTCSSGPVQDYQDMWWAGSAETGWGLTITQHGDALFLAWYIYDSDGHPLWVVMPNGQWNAAHTTYTGALYIPSGSWFGSYQVGRFAANAPVGSASIAFTSPSAGTLTYSVNGVSGNKSVSRMVFGRVDTAPITNYTDMWWGGQAENGWGVVLTQQYHNIFAAWYTYDLAGQTTWLVMPDGTWTSANTYTGALYRTRSSPVIGAAYDASALVVTPAGTLTLTFGDANTATMTYTVDGLTQTKAITRIPF
jgi:chitodextrinase